MQKVQTKHRLFENKIQVEKMAVRKRVCGLCYLGNNKVTELKWNPEKGSLRYCPVHDREVSFMFIEVE